MESECWGGVVRGGRVESECGGGVVSSVGVGRVESECRGEW